MLENITKLFLNIVKQKHWLKFNFNLLNRFMETKKKNNLLIINYFY